MGSQTEDAEQAIRELIARRDAGELTEDTYREAVLPHAAIIAEARDAEQAAQVAQQADQDARWRAMALLAVDYAEREPMALRAAVAGLVHGLGVYLRAMDIGEGN